VSDILADLQTVPVHVTNAHELSQPGPPERPDLSVTAQTFLLTSSHTAERILDRDEARVRALVTAPDAAVFLCHTSGAAASAAASAADGNAKSIAIPNPGLGATLTYVLPYPAQILAFTALYTAGAAAGNRFPRIDLLDTAGNQFAFIPFTNAGIAPSTSDQVWAALGAPYSPQDQFNAYTTIPNVGILPAGFQIRLSIQNAGDQITGARALLYVPGTGAAVSGYVLRPGLPPFEDRSGDPLWAVYPSDASGTLRVSVYAERRRG
jgi:hypothetical protein